MPCTQPDMTVSQTSGYDTNVFSDTTTPIQLSGTAQHDTSLTSILLETLKKPLVLYDTDELLVYTTAVSLGDTSAPGVAALPGNMVRFVGGWLLVCFVACAVQGVQQHHGFIQHCMYAQHFTLQTS